MLGNEYIARAVPVINPAAEQNDTSYILLPLAAGIIIGELIRGAHRTAD